MSSNTPLPDYTFVFSSGGAPHITVVKFADDDMAKDYACRTLRDSYRTLKWTTVAVANGAGDDVNFVGAWDRAADGSMVWTPTGGGVSV